MSTKIQILATDSTEPKLFNYFLLPLKGLVAKSANVECISPIHHSNSPAIKNSDPFDIFADVRYIIKPGTIVRIQGTRCDGKVDCWNGVDEDDCGFSTFKTLFIGTNFSNLNLIDESRALSSPPIYLRLIFEISSSR